MHHQTTSVRMVKEDFPSVFLIENHKNLGFAAANNIGIGASSGEYILLLNSDTIVHPTVLTTSINYLENTQTAGALGCRVLNEDGSLQHSTSQFPSILNLAIQNTWARPPVRHSLFSTLQNAVFGTHFSADGRNHIRMLSVSATRKPSEDWSVR